MIVAVQGLRDARPANERVEHWVSLEPVSRRVQTKGWRHPDPPQLPESEPGFGAATACDPYRAAQHNNLHIRLDRRPELLSGQLAHRHLPVSAFRTRKNVASRDQLPPPFLPQGRLSCARPSWPAIRTEAKYWQGPSDLHDPAHELRAIGRLRL